MRLFIDSDTVFDVGDRVRTSDEKIFGTVVEFVVKIQPDNENLARLVAVDGLEIVESASDLIRGWTRENEIRQYAEVHHTSIAGALALLANSGLSHL